MFEMMGFRLVGSLTQKDKCGCHSRLDLGRDNYIEMLGFVLVGSLTQEDKCGCHSRLDLGRDKVDEIVEDQSNEE